MRIGNCGPSGVIVMMTTLIALLLGCSKKAAPDQEPKSQHAGPFVIYTVNYPLSYFAQRMAPVGARVVFPVPPGIDPAFWKPTADAVQGFQSASLILLNGAGYARWTRYTTLPRTRIVVTADGCRDGYLHTEQSVRHQHGPEGEHAHSDLACTTWLDLRLAACQASHVRDALLERWPEVKDAVSTGFETLEQVLLDLDARLRTVGKVLDGRPILASHPVYQYLADAYGLSVQSLHLEPDQALSDDDWKELEAMLKQQDAEWMLWEAPPLKRTKLGLDKRGIAVIVFDPAGQAPSDGDFLTVMQANVGRLECAVGVKACP